MIGNAGSFFKNPQISTKEYENLAEKFPGIPAHDASPGMKKIPAAWLIEKAGWKGKRFGNHGVHEKQALVLVNYGGANGQDLYELSGKILNSVTDLSGIVLEREVNVI